MANVPPNDPNVDASAIVPAPVNTDHALAQPVEEDTEEEEEDPEEDPEGDDDNVMEMDDKAEVIDPYMNDGSNNPSPPNSEDEETPPTSPVIPDAGGHPILHIASFGQNFHFGESSSTTNLLTGNSKIVSTGPMCPNLGTAWKRLGKMEKLMSKRIDTEGRIKKKFKEQDRHFVGLGCDNIEMDRAVRNVMSDLSGLKKLVKDLSDRFNETMPPKKSTRGNPPPLLTQDTMNHFMKCSPITFRGNEGAVGGHFGNKSHDQEKVGRMKVMMTEEFCPPEEIQRMEGELWNLRVKEMDIFSYTTRFNELMILCPGWDGAHGTKEGKMEKFMSERIDTEGRIKKKFKEQDRHFLGLGCDNIKTDRIVRNVMSDLFRVKKLVKGLSDLFDEYERSKVFDAKRVLEKEL
nr:hypothetical protein [Tanacetum cinerariifolium]